MNIHLDTKNDSETLSLLNVVQLGHGDFECFLHVKSDWLECKKKFYFGIFYVREFLENLKKIDAHLEGSAILQHEYEDDYIDIKCLSRGRISVKGEITTHSWKQQKVIFHFETDQTILKSLIKDFEKLLG